MNPQTRNRIAQQISDSAFSLDLSIGLANDEHNDELAYDLAIAKKQHSLILMEIAEKHNLKQLKVKI